MKHLFVAAHSYYWDIFGEQVRTRRNGKLLQTVTPGYYGPRGSRAMSENILSNFAQDLRDITVKNRLVAKGGLVVYIQNVLVPELAVRLISEDMECGMEEARQIMRNSAGLGDLLSEEVEDVVVWNGEDQNGENRQSCGLDSRP